MLTKSCPQLAITVSVLYTLTVLLRQVVSTPSGIRYGNNFNQYPIVYRRYIRRKPPLYLHDHYMEEILEIFDTKEKPSSYGTLMTDEDVDKFIYCDFNRHVNICQQYLETRKPTRPTFSRTTPKSPRTSILTSSTPRPTITTTTTTTSAGKSETTTEAIVGIPHLDESEYVYSDENQNNNNHEEGNGDTDYYAEKIDY